MSDESVTWPAAIWLQNERYALRAPVPEDADCACAWYEGTYPISPVAARALLVEQESIPWGGNPTIRLIVTARDTGVVVGGAIVERQNDRVGKLQVIAGGPDRAATDAQHLRAAVLGMLVPWVMDELNMMTAVIDVPADETVVIDAARALGLVEVVRLREHIVRPDGRVDLVMLERVDRHWGRRDA